MSGYSAPYVKPVTVAFAAAALCGLGVEIGLHTLTNRPTVVSEWILEDPRLIDPDTITSYLQFRDDDYYDIDDARLTLVVLGDSFTQGYPVPPEDGYPAELGRLLDDAGISVNRIDLGMGDSAPGQQLRIFERDLLTRLTPDIVVWQFYTNDVWGEVSKAVYTTAEDRLIPLDARQHWLYRRQKIFDVTPFNDTLRRNIYAFRYFLKMFERGQTAAVPPEYTSRVRVWGQKKIALEVERMIELANKYGFETYFVLVAPQALQAAVQRDSVDEPHLQELIGDHEAMLKILERQTNFIDASFYEPDGRTLRADVFVDDGRDRLAPGSRHYNEEGYRLLAQLIFDRLQADRALSR